jgi:hypothetical protein
MVCAKDWDNDRRAEIGTEVLRVRSCMGIAAVSTVQVESYVRES